ncbi:MAG: hypothetical protein ACETV1_04210 [Candidatus Bathyarchaeia archaeon]
MHASRGPSGRNKETANPDNSLERRETCAPKRSVPRNSVKGKNDPAYALKGAFQTRKRRMRRPIKAAESIYGKK